MHLFFVYVRALALLSTLALAATAAAQAAQPRGTLAGVVTRGPITPVCVAEQPCDEPAAHVALVFSRHGSALRVVSDGRGRYRVSLPPGIYRVRRGSAPAPDRKLEPVQVRVVAGRVRTVDFSIDTGIR